MYFKCPSSHARHCWIRRYIFADPAVSTTAPDNPPLASATENAGPTVIAVAANFTSTLEEIVIPFKKAYPKCQKIDINQGSSGDLYNKIQEGAPFDLFLSANANYTKLDFMKNSHRRIPAAQTAGPIHWIMLWYKSCQSGFIFWIRSIFHCLFHSFNLRTYAKLRSLRWI